MNREAIYAALWDKLSAIEGFKTKSRRLQHWTDVEKRGQPALFMSQTGESVQTTTGLPPRWTLRVQVYIYVSTQTGKPPGPLINPLIDAVCNSISAPHPVTGRSTLDVPGVEWCRVEGSIDTDEGTLGDQAVAVIPITIFST